MLFFLNPYVDYPLKTKLELLYLFNFAYLEIADTVAGGESEMWTVIL